MGGGKEMDRKFVEHKQQIMKKCKKSGRKPRSLSVAIGDMVRLKKPDGIFTEPQEIIKVGKHQSP